MNFYCCVMYSGVECVVCCYSECIYHTRQAGSIPTVVRLIFQFAWCGIYTQCNNTLHIYEICLVQAEYTVVLVVSVVLVVVVVKIY